MASTGLEVSQNPGLLQDLLHSLSQPLTTLHCALEHSLEQEEAEHDAGMAFALEQTDRAIALVRLMREYVDAESGCFLAEPFPLGLAIENVLEQLSVLAESRGLGVFAYGTSIATVPVRGIWLQRALFYLVGELLDSKPRGWAIMLLLEDGAAHSIISGHCVPMNPSASLSLESSPQGSEETTLRHVKLEIARCVLACAGASLDFHSNGRPSFLIRLPKSGSHLQEIPA